MKKVSTASATEIFSQVNGHGKGLPGATINSTFSKTTKMQIASTTPDAKLPSSGSLGSQRKTRARRP